MTDLSFYIRALKGPIIVTGASGFIGANLFKLLFSVRQDVFACVRFEKGWRLANIADEYVVDVDFNDANSTKNLIDSIRPNTVFNLVAYGAYSFEKDPQLIYQTNFQSVVNLVTALVTKPIAAFVHAGSSSEYGINCSAPKESDGCIPNSHYAVSKLAASDYLTYLGRQCAFPCANLRLYSVYGPLEDTSRLIPNLLRHALSGRFPPLVHPSISRDFVHIDDVCAAFIMAAVKMNPELYGESFNIGSGVKTTIKDLAELAQALFNITENPIFQTMEDRAWDLKEWYANPSKAIKTLGWIPEKGLKEGLRSTSEWIASLTDAQIASVTKMSPQSRKRTLSAIVACYKDEQAIPVMHERLTKVFKKLGIDYEIIFINDCSPDNSAEVIRLISESDPHVIGVSHSRNFGSQMAFRSGMEISTKDAVIFLDGDLQDPPEVVEAFYEKWNEGFQVVYGRRIKREMPWHLEALYKLFYRVLAAFSYIKIPVDAGDFSLIDRRVVNWLLKFPERDLFMRGLRAYVGFRQCGVDYARPERMFGRSTNNWLKNIEWAKRGIFSFSNAPLTMLTATGILCLAVSLMLALIVITLRIFVPDIAPRGTTTLLVGILVFGSANLFAIGLIGEYVAKIMVEVKGRPRLIRSSLIRHGRVTDSVPDGKLQ